MAKFSTTSIALKWHYFSYISSVCVYSEYFNLFMKQLGFNTAQIGLSTLLGALDLLILSFLLLGEKFQARKTVLVIVALGVAFCCILPLGSLIVPALHPKCYPTTSLHSSNASVNLRKASMHSKYANDTKASGQTASKYGTFPYLTPANNGSLAPVLRNRSVKFPKSIIRQPASIPMRDAVQTNGSSHMNYSSDPIDPSNIYHPQPSLSALFLLLTISRSPLLLFKHTDQALANLATITYLKGENASYGVYFMWSNIGTALSICFVAGFAWFIRISICGIENYGYFIAFIWGFVMTLLSMLSLPWFKYEYAEKKSFNWSGVKSDVFNAHYVFMFFVLFCTGLCVSFQTYWEFWYLDKLSASPLLLGGAVLIRRPLIALSTLASSYLMRKIGDLKTVCVALLLYALSFLALSFARIAWTVLFIDTFQAVANGINYCALTVLFYKASSKENSSIILG